MCVGTHQYARTTVCQVGDLTPGQRYRDPEGNTWMVVQDFSDYDDSATVANLRTGKLERVPNSINLGHDREGRFYAGRFINPVEDDNEKVNLAECLPAPDALREAQKSVDRAFGVLPNSDSGGDV